MKSKTFGMYHELETRVLVIFIIGFTCTPHQRLLGPLLHRLCHTRYPNPAIVHQL